MRHATTRRVRLTLRDLSATCAFASIAVSGSVALWAIGLFGICLLLALTGRRVLAHHTGWAVAGLLLAALVLFGSALRGGIDLVVAACTFASLVTAHRMLAEPTPATDSQVHLTSLLMVAGGAALSGELTFAFSLLAFAVCATVSLGLGVIEEAVTPGEDIPVRPVVRQLAWGALAAIVCGSIFFVAFPRLSWNVAARRTSPGLGRAASGFSDRVRLGGSGELKSNPQVVLRARLTPDPKIPMLSHYWLGRTFDRFTGQEWLGSGGALRLAPRLSVGTRGERGIQQQIELLPAYGSRTLVAIEPVMGFGSGMALGPTGANRAPFIEYPGDEVRIADGASAYSYVAASRSSGDSSSPEPEGDLERYLALPSIDPRVKALAAQVVGEERSPLAAAHKLESFLKKSYRYTLELPGSSSDPLADFLFRRKEGHCEDFATALAAMLRTQGFAARVAAGFFGGERIGDLYVLRGGDAHAWVQVLVPGQGFVTVDATPEENRRGSPSLLMAFVSRWYERLEGLWRQRVLDYSIFDQAELVQALVRSPEGVRSEMPVRMPPMEAWGGAALAGTAVWIFWRFSGRWKKRRPHPAARFAAQIDRALGKAGVARVEAEPLEEVTARLSNQQHPLAPPLRAATRRYLEARFGGRPLDRQESALLLARLSTVRPPSDRL